MAKKNKIGLQFDGLEQMIANYEKAGLSAKGAAENALKASKAHVNKALTRDTVKANYPAKGKYSNGDLARSINKDYTVKWSGLTAEIEIGYNFPVGLIAAFMIHGSPKYMKVQKIYNDFYGSKIKKELAQLQEEAMSKVLERQ